MKTKLITLGILLLISTVNAEYFESELGDLDYALPTVGGYGSFADYPNEWVSERDQNMIYLALPYAGKYELTLHSSNKIDIYKTGSSGNMNIATQLNNGYSVNFTTSKPFFGLSPWYPYDVMTIYKDSTIKLIEVDYTYTNYSENMNNNHPMICPYSNNCTIQQHVRSFISGTVMTNTLYNIEWGYNYNIDFDLTNYCNIIDNPSEIVEITSIVYDRNNPTEFINVLQYAQLNNYIFNYTLSPINDLPVELQYNDNYIFSVIVESYDYLAWNENNSVSWYWDGYLLHPYQEVSKVIDLNAMNNMGWNVEPGSHQLKATTYFTCGITEEIIWDINVIRTTPENLTAHTVIISVTDCMNDTYLDNVNCTLSGNGNIYSVISDYDFTGLCIFNDPLIPTGTYTLEIFKPDLSFSKIVDTVYIHNRTVYEYCLPICTLMYGYTIDDLTYAPIPNANISFSTYSISGMPIIHEIQSDSSGYYEICLGCMEIAIYRIEIYAQDYLFFNNYCEMITHQCIVEEKNWLLREGKYTNFIISGTVVNTSSSTLNNTIIGLCSYAGTTQYITSENGTFEFLNITGDIGGNEYSLLFEKDGYIDSLYQYEFGVSRCGEQLDTDIINGEFVLLSNEEANYYSLNITVINYITTIPVPNVKVVILKGITETAYTSSSGIVQFTNISEGNVLIILTKDGYEYNSITHLLEKDDNISISIFPESETLNALGGTVVNIDGGTPITNALVRLYTCSDNNTLTLFREYTTSTDGSYEFYQLPDGLYFINTTHRHFNSVEYRKYITESIYDFVISLGSTGDFHSIEVLVYYTPCDYDPIACGIENADVRIYSDDHDETKQTSRYGQVLFTNVFQTEYQSTHTISASKEGYKTKTLQVTINSDKIGDDRFKIGLSTGTTWDNETTLSTLGEIVPPIFMLLLILLLMSAMRKV